MSWDSEYNSGGDAVRRLRPGEMFLRSYSVEFVHPEPPPGILWDCDDDGDNDIISISMTVLPEEALDKAEERRGRQGDAGSDINNRGIAVTDRPSVFRVKGKPGAMRVVVLLPEKFMQTYKIWAG